jgi:hypothetical protein
MKICLTLQHHSGANTKISFKTSLFLALWAIKTDLFIKTLRCFHSIAVITPLQHTHQKRK